MSRSGGDGEENFPNEAALWWANADRALRGKRGRKALADLREALLALPEKRLIARALSTVGKPEPERYPDDHRDLLAEQGEGMCAVGAYAWHQRVKAGADPLEAMRSLPLNADYDGDPWVTQRVGEDAGLAGVLAWQLMSRNDDTYEGLTPEQRHDAYLAWIDEQLAVPAPADARSDAQ